jgi:hypothetical protein
MVAPKTSEGSNKTKPDAGSSAGQNAGRENLKQAIFDLGGDEEDVQLLESVDSDAEIEESNMNADVRIPISTSRACTLSEPFIAQTIQGSRKHDQ